MNTTETAEKYCIVGAGSSGLAAAKQLLDAGVPFDCLEREDDVGGNWYYGRPHSSVYASTHLISSKPLTEYAQFPMPEEYPDYPNHRQVWQYLRSYARHFQLYEHIQLNTPIAHIEPSDSGWNVELATGERRWYRGVIIANGHNWDPQWPDYPGEFAGETLHSSQYKTPEALRGKRVLVVGGGNSGCDLACEAAIHAEQALHSTRRAYHVLPKFFRGKPMDQCGELLLWLRLPLWLRRGMARVVSGVVLGPAWRTGLPRPDHKLFESHPILNSQLHHHVGHGRLQLRPDVQRLDGQTVRFVDGQEDSIDLILYATGYRISFPFLDSALLNWQDGAPRLLLNIFHPERNDLFCIGLIQPDSGQFGLVERQARLVAVYLQAVAKGKTTSDKMRRRLAAGRQSLSGGVRYVDSPRHRLEVEHYSYRRTLERLSNSLARQL